MYDPVAFSIPEGVDYKEHIIATYSLQTPRQVNIHKAAMNIAEIQSGGTWPNIPYDMASARSRHYGRIVGIWEVPDHAFAVPSDVVTRDWVIQIAYPIHNLNAQIPLMMTAMYGEIASTGRVKLLDLHFPEAYVAHFKGPKIGVEGLRKILDVPERPLILAILKPPIGMTPDESAGLFYSCAMGGCDAVKDDELLVETPWSSIVDRVKKHGEAAKKAYEATGQKTLYFVNITNRPDRMVENAYRAMDAGASGLMVNYITVGISAVSMLADDPNISLPILGHLNFSGGIINSPYHGMSAHLLLGKLPRLAGIDALIYPNPYGKLSLLASQHLKIAQALTDSFYHLKRSLPIAGGGVTAGSLPLLFQDLGRDFMAAAGSSLYSHPMGATAGAIALRQALDAVMQDIPLQVAAEGQAELRAALDRWGIPSQ